MKNSLRILRIEWMKVRYYRTFWILSGVIAICIPAFNYVIFDVMDNTFPKMNGQSLLGNPFSYPHVWRTVPYFSGLLLFIPAILIITLFTNEFTYRTHRQNIIDGWSRSQFVFAKLSEVLLLSVAVSIIVFCSTLYFDHRNKTGAEPALTWMQLRYILFYFIQMLSYSMIALLMAMLIKRAGLAMGIFFLYMIVEQFVVSICRNKYDMHWVDYLPEEVTDRLIPQAIAPKLQTTEFVTAWEKQIPSFLWVSLAYLVFYIGIVSWRFRKADL